MPILRRSTSPTDAAERRNLLRRVFSLLLIGATMAFAAVTALRAPAAEAASFSAGGSLPSIGSGRIWAVAAEPSLPATVLAGSDRGIYVSHDSGATWQQTSFTGHRVWAVGFDARNGATAFAGTDGQGVVASTDGGLTWSPSSTGLANQHVRSLAFGLDGIAAGTDSGVALSPDGHTWHDGGLDGDSIAAVAVSTNSPQFTVVAGSDGATSAGGSLFRSSGGSAWQTLQSGLPASAVVSSISAGPIDQAVPQRPLVVATGKGLFRSGDGGTTWTSSTGIAQTLIPTTVTFSALDPNLVYAGSDAGGSTGGDLLRSTDGGVSFTPADQGLPQATKNIEDIAVGQTNPPTVIAALDPPGAAAAVYTEVDTAAPSPPQLVAESPGASVPAVAGTPPPTPRPTAAAVRPRPTPAPLATGFGAFAASAFHWPIPLIYELIFVLLVAYLLIRWRQHYYVEGPP